MKKAAIILVFIGFITSLTFIIMENTKEDSLAPMSNSSEYSGKIGEIISYIDHPIITINDISIKYLQSTPGNPELRLGGFDEFEISNGNGKSYQIDWSSGTGVLPGPSSFLTSDGCYELHINVIEGSRLEDIQGKLRLNKSSSKTCPEWAKDLR